MWKTALALIMTRVSLLSDGATPACRPKSASLPRPRVSETEGLIVGNT
jgi:hypothetical protein